MRYALRTALALTLLEVVISSAQATGRVGTALDGIANATKYLLSPAYPLVPDRRAAASATSTQPAAPSQPTTPTQNVPIPPAPISMTPSPPKVISV